MDTKVLMTVVVGVLISLLAWELFLKDVVVKMLPAKSLDEEQDA